MSIRDKIGEVVRSTANRTKEVVKERVVRRYIKEKVRKKLGKKLKKLRSDYERKFIKKQIRYSEISSIDYLSILLAALFLYALFFGEFNFPTFLFSSLILLISILTFFQGRVKNDLMFFILSLGILTVFSLVVVYIFRDPYFFASLSRSFTKAYKPFIDSMSKLSELILAVLGIRG